MNRPDRPTKLPLLSALAALSALGAAFVVAPGEAAPRPTLQNQAASEVAQPATEASSAEPRRTVRVVYVGPITAR